MKMKLYAQGEAHEFLTVLQHLTIVISFDFFREMSFQEVAATHAWANDLLQENEELQRELHMLKANVGAAGNTAQLVWCSLSLSFAEAQSDEREEILVWSNWNFFWSICKK